MESTPRRNNRQHEGFAMCELVPAVAVPELVLTRYRARHVLSADVRRCVLLNRNFGSWALLKGCARFAQ
jgi:hypothetical protein